MKYRKIVFGLMLVITMILSACNTTKYLSDSENLVVSSQIKVYNNTTNVSKTAIELELDPYIALKPNTNSFFLIPKEYIYYKNQEKENERGFRKFMRNTLGEPPTIYDSTLVQNTVADMQNYLRVSKGYYEAEVTSVSKIENRKAKITYNTYLNDRYRIKSISYISEDSAVLRAIIEDAGNAVVKKGDYIDGASLELEKNRITNKLQDQGYAQFLTQYIDIKGDSSFTEKNVELFFEILKPSPTENHKIYTNGAIRVYTDYYNKQDTFSLVSEEIDGITFLRESSDWVVEPKHLSKLIYFNKNEQTNRSQRSRTFRKMSELSAYKFAAINAYANPNDSTEIEYDVLLTPQNFKWVGDFGLETCYSSGAQFRNLFGFSVNGKLINRNFLKGSEQYSLTGDVSTELSFDNNSGENRQFVVARTFSAGLQNSIEYPRIIKYTQLSKLFKNTGIISNGLYEGFQEDATSNVSIGLRTQNLLNYFRVNSAKASLGYKYNDGLKHNVSLDQFGITLNDVTPGPLFDSLCLRSPIYCLNLQDNLFSGILFNNLLYVYNRPNLFGNTNYSAVFNLETSGLEIFAVNKLSNLITGNNTPWRLFNDRFEFSKFIKMEIDNRFTKRIAVDRSLAWRFDIGALIPYGENKITPFIRQFSAGGPNSLRGWLPRQLVGELVDTVSTFLPLYQGDIKLEANVEFRFDLVSFFEGAFFIDAGNVWQITSVSEPRARFTKDFYKQIAVAAGWGLRMDFNYFIIRIDFGYKVRNPYPQETGGGYWYNWHNIRRQGLGNPQIGINYPF
ncbi:MAG: BamA/TamA family outer membrane protein [Saprospiraceae bacterium]|nr:BamA/TamA family outer membrane protein [Saprospiraceae bacterium]